MGFTVRPWPRAQKSPQGVVARHLLGCTLPALAGGPIVKVLHTKERWFLGVFFGVSLLAPGGEELAVVAQKFCRAIWSWRLLNSRVTAAGLLRRHLERSPAWVTKGMCLLGAAPGVVSTGDTPRSAGTGKRVGGVCRGVPGWATVVAWGGAGLLWLGVCEDR